jgi:dTDP-4-amino-4,6-dideoxygalactose transaminase
MRSMVRALGQRTVKSAGIERVATGTQHFNPRHVDLGMSPLTLRVAQAQDLNAIVERRRRNYFFLLSQLREVSAPLFHQLPAGTCPLFYPLVVSDKAAVLAGLRERGIEAIDFWGKFHPACSASEFPEVARLRETIVEVPCHQDLTPEVMAGVSEAVKEVVRTSGVPRRAAG